MLFLIVIFFFSFFISLANSIKFSEFTESVLNTIINEDLKESMELKNRKIKDMAEIANIILLTFT